MRAVDLIMRKRDGDYLNYEEIRFLVDGYVKGDIPDYQMASFLMAVFFRGMSFEEASNLTKVMIESGDVYNLEEIGQPLIDKHSTGGVGDKVSLILAPLAAACGVKVPMMSGRGLGHTGGTLDKLESIPGYTTALTEREFIEGLKKIGFCMIGQSERVVPADRKMYALRDVTATVESIPLITASILSKKFAEGADGLVFDVKSGSGAFMKTFDDSLALAESLVKTGNQLGKRIIAVISDMNTPLGRKVGNFLEVKEAVECLKGNCPDDLYRLTLRLTAWMVVLAGIRENVDEALKLCEGKIRDGSAFNKFLENVEYQHGDVNVILDLSKGPKAKYKRPLIADKTGYIESFDAFKVGLSTVILGAGRSRKEDEVLPGVGVEFLRVSGDSVKEGDEICLVYAEDEKKLAEAMEMLRSALTYGDKPLKKEERVLKEIIS